MDANGSALKMSKRYASTTTFPHKQKCVKEGDKIIGVKDGL
jgi:hypothetical protein